MSTSKITVVREWWQVETREGGKFIPFNSSLVHSSEADARWFMEQFKRCFAKIPARVCHHVQTKETLP